MQVGSRVTAKRKRKFEAVLLPDGSNEPPTKLPKSLDTLLSRPQKTRAGQTAKKLSPVRDWEIDSYPLCSLLYSTIGAKSWESAKVPLRTFSSTKMEDRTWCSISTNLLEAGYAGRYIVSQSKGINGHVRVIKENIDSFDIVKTWINLCQGQHTKVCSIENQSTIPGLRLIDCDTKNIVPGEAHPYVALSYVWGHSSETSGDPNKLPEHLPNTIEDAITVTKRLGYCHIWIDRYCINQKNAEQTADQVGKMDVIYQNAELTIIAAVGKDPSYGLPGVGSRKRAPKYLTACAKVGRHFLISTDAWPEGANANTRWKTRAWTYQEAILSRRRLVFGKRQMYFECYGMYCCEALDFPLESLHRKDMQGFKRVFCSEKLVGVFPRGVGTTGVEIVRRIEEYSKLNLTNPSDILKGMLGILNAFQRSRLGIHHYAGIPILPSMPAKDLSKPIEGWTRSMGFFTGLFWDLETRSERRHGFPSWSWTGWHGPVTWGGFGERAWPSIKVDPNVEVNANLMDGRKLTLESFKVLRSNSSPYTKLSNTIQITAWIIEVEILSCHRKDRYECRLRLEDGGYLDWSFKSISKIGFLPGDLCKGIILGYDFGGPVASTGPAILVCGKVGDTMERIGLGWVDQFSYKRYDKEGVWEFKGEPPGLLLNPISEQPLLLVKSWEEVQLG